MTDNGHHQIHPGSIQSTSTTTMVNTGQPSDTTNDTLGKSFREDVNESMPDFQRKEQLEKARLLVDEIEADLQSFTDLYFSEYHRLVEREEKALEDMTHEQVLEIVRALDTNKVVKKRRLDAGHVLNVQAIHDMYAFEIDRIETLQRSEKRKWRTDMLEELSTRKWTIQIDRFNEWGTMEDEIYALKNATHPLDDTTTHDNLKDDERLFDTIRTSREQYKIGQLGHWATRVTESDPHTDYSKWRNMSDAQFMKQKRNEITDICQMQDHGFFPAGVLYGLTLNEIDDDLGVLKDVKYRQCPMSV